MRRCSATIGAPSIESLFEEIPAELRMRALAGVPGGAERAAGHAADAGARARRTACRSTSSAPAPTSTTSRRRCGRSCRAASSTAPTRPTRPRRARARCRLIYEYQSMITRADRHAGGQRVDVRRRHRGRRSLPDGRARQSQVARPRASSCRRRCIRTIGPSRRHRPAARDWSSKSSAYERGQRPDRPATRSRPYDGQDVTALVIQQPNFFGVLEDVDALTDWAHARGALVIAVVNPTSLAVLKPPGQWGARGADIVVGDGQPLGVPLSSGGPYFGFMATRMDYVRQMPGRIVGRTVDLDGQPRIHADAAGARAAHPPRQGDLQHLHQPGTADDRRHDLPGADGCRGPGARGRTPAWRARASWSRR